MPLFTDLTTTELVDLIYRVQPGVTRTVLVYSATCPACRYTLEELDAVDLSDDSVAVGTIEASNLTRILSELPNKAATGLTELLLSEKVPHFAKFSADGQVHLRDGGMDRSELQRFLQS